MLTAALQYELQIAKQQSQDLQRTSEFFDALLLPKPTSEEPQSHIRNKSRTEDISLPSANSTSALPPLPQLIGWELPPFPGDRISPKLKSEKTAKPDPIGPLTQHPSLADALAKARKELEDKTALVKDLEDALKREKSARELAEDRAAELETASRALGGTSRERILGEFEAEKVLADERGEMDDTETICGDDEKSLDGQPMEDETNPEGGDTVQVKVDPSALAAAEAANRLQRRVEEMMLELQSARAEIETYKFRTKAAEKESDTTRKTLQEMVEDFQRKEEARKAKERQFGSQTEPATVQNAGMQANTDMTHDEIMETAINGTVKQSDIVKKLPSRTTMVSEDLARTSLALSKRNAAPYVSIIGVMLLGVGMMAVLNSWQKGER